MLMGEEFSNQMRGEAVSAEATRRVLYLPHFKVMEEESYVLSFIVLKQRHLEGVLADQVRVIPHNLKQIQWF